MTTIETYGKCKCGEFNSLGEVVCCSCGARLPWAPTPRATPNAASRTASNLPPFIPGITTRAQSAQAGYWNTALTGQKGTPSRPGSYDDPDIDFSAFAGSASNPNGDVDKYCTACGTGLKAGQTICHRCRRLSNYTRADLRFSMMVSSLVVTGFVLGAVWCAIIINYFHTGAWTMPGAKIQTVQPAPAPPKKLPEKPKLPDAPYRGTPGQ